MRLFHLRVRAACYPMPPRLRLSGSARIWPLSRKPCCVFCDDLQMLYHPLRIYYYALW